MVWVRKIPTGWWLAGVVVLSAAAATSALSFRFVYGENHAGRPIYAFLALYLLGWGGFAYAAMRAMRGGGGVPVLFVVIVGLAARAILLPSNLIQENDCYRYVLDGEAVLHGVNPYRHAPEDVASDTRGAFARSLEGKDARLVVSRIGYRHIPTIYPPAAQAAFAVGARLTPWDWRGQRWVFLAFDVATMALLLHVLRATGKPAAWIVVYAWNPLILKEVANAAHLDAMAGFCIVLTVWAMVRWAASDRSAYAAVAGCALALAVLTKLYPLLLVPACLAFLWGRRRQWKAPAVFALALLAVTCLAYVPFLGVGLARMTEGLRTYGAEWQRNDGAFRIVQTAFRPVGGLAWGSVSRTISNPRLATACIVGAFALVQAWRAGKGKRRELLKRSESQVRAAKETRDRPVSLRSLGSVPLLRSCFRGFCRFFREGEDGVLNSVDRGSSEAGLFSRAPCPDDLVAALQTSLLCWFLFLPAAYPWYAIGVLALSALRPRPWAIVLSGAFGLYYLLFLYGYRNYGPAWKLATQAMEHGLVWVALIVGFLVNRANRGPAQDPTW